MCVFVCVRVCLCVCARVRVRVRMCVFLTHNTHFYLSRVNLTKSHGIVPHDVGCGCEVRKVHNSSDVIYFWDLMHANHPACMLVSWLIKPCTRAQASMPPTLIVTLSKIYSFIIRLVRSNKNVREVASL